MTDTWRCDNCQKIGTHFERGWREVRMVGPINIHDAADRYKHFCSAQCLSNYYKEKAWPPPITGTATLSSKKARP